MSLAWLVISCDPPDDPAPNNPTPTLSATELPKAGNDDIRVNFVLFSIATDTDTAAGEYRIGAKLANKAAPDADELILATAALTRRLSTAETQVYLPFHIEGNLFSAATPTYTDGLNTMLAPATDYNIYSVKADGTGAVKKVLKITTDAVPATHPHIFGFPLDVSVKAGEPFLFAVKIPINSGSMSYTIDGEIVPIAECVFTTCFITSGHSAMSATDPAKLNMLGSGVESSFLYSSQYSLGEVKIIIGEGISTVKINIQLQP